MQQVGVVGASVSHAQEIGDDVGNVSDSVKTHFGHAPEFLRVRVWVKRRTTPRTMVNSIRAI